MRGIYVMRAKWIELKKEGEAKNLMLLYMTR